MFKTADIFFVIRDVDIRELFAVRNNREQREPYVLCLQSNNIRRITNLWAYSIQSKFTYAPDSRKNIDT